MSKTVFFCLAMGSVFVWLSGCAAAPLATPVQQARPVEQPMNDLRASPEPAIAITPLPGGLDQRRVLHSNSPERIETAGVVISTRTQRGDAFLGQSLRGDFGLFLHHVARTPILSGEQIYLGLIATLPESTASADLELLRGNAFLTRPDAPFVVLPAVQANPEGRIFAGPGDRLALADLQQQSNLKPQHWQVSAPVLLFSWQLPTNPFFVVQQDNALSALLHFRSSQDLDLSLVAISASQPPALADYLKILQGGQRAGPPDAEATIYDPAEPPGGGSFRYGRVAGLVQGSQWQGQISLSPTQIEALNAGTALGWPLSSLYLKRYDTGQSQSAPVLKRLPGSAMESQGNYGVHYRLQIDLPAQAQARRYRLTLAQPQSVKAGQAVFIDPPASQVTFRGSLQVTDTATSQRSTTHLVLHTGERPAPFWQQDLAAGEARQLALEWVYPPDATPPQLLLLASEAL